MPSTSLRISAPPRVVFEYLAEPRNRAQWQSSLRTVELLTDGSTRVGTRWLDRTKMGVAPCLEITAMTPPSASAVTDGSWSEVGHWHGLTATLTLRFVPVAVDPATVVPVATDVEVSLDAFGRGFWKPAAPVLRVLAPPAVRADLRRAGRIIESGRGA